MAQTLVPQARPGPATLFLLVLFGASFVVQLVLDATLGVSLPRLLALTYELDVSLLWRIVTYPLVEGPGNVLGRFLGLLFAYLMLGQHEQQHGARSTLLVALAGVLGAAVLCTPVGLLGFASPLVGLSPLLWAPMGVMLVHAGDRPVRIFSFELPNARAATGVLLLLPAASALYDHDPTPILEAVGAGAAGLLFALAPLRAAARAARKKPLRKHSIQVIRGGGESKDDDDRPRWLN